MGIIFGSARIDENGKISGGAAGDQTGKEISTQPYYMSSKGFYRLRAKDPEVAVKLAAAMMEACDNNNIGYDQGARNGIVTNAKKYGSIKKIKAKTEADCSSTIRACVWQATGVDVGTFSTADEVKVLEASGLFEKHVEVKSAKDLRDGDIVVTKTKGHTLIVVSGAPREDLKKEEPAKKEPVKKDTPKKEPSIKVVKATSPASSGPDNSKAGKYKTTTMLNMRNGAGVANSQMVVIPAGAVCTCHGFYSRSAGTDWLYITCVINNVQYEGFASSKYLLKI